MNDSGNQYFKMIAEGLCDTYDAENSAFHHLNKLQFEMY